MRKLSETDRRKVIPIYQQIADLTFNHCKSTCKVLGSCCSTEYCNLAMQGVWEEHGIKLIRLREHPYLPLMTRSGACSIPPFLRPLCALHSCDICSLGVFKGDEVLTRRYFRLRKRLDEIECKRYNKPYEYSYARTLRLYNRKKMALK